MTPATGGLKKDKIVDRRSRGVLYSGEDGAYDLMPNEKDVSGMKNTQFLK